MDTIQKQLLEAVAGLHEIPVGAYNIRANGKSEGRNSTEHIEITTREEGDGIIIRIKDGTKKESVHIPVIMSQAGLEEVVYNDFYVGDDCDVTIIAGCGIHNGGDASSRHDGIHSFFIGKNSRVKYVEKHYGSGDGKGQRIMNPETIIEVGENSVMEMDTAQIKGVDSTKRMTRAKLMDGASLKVMERLMTHGTQDAESRFIVDMDGEDSGPILCPAPWQRMIPISFSSPCSTETRRAADIRNVMPSLWAMPRSALSRRSLQTVPTQRSSTRLPSARSQESRS